jgi:ectoine hydroxylase-related dioxygenase (phytanoyl-CoA dioxygenase family)
MMLPHQQKDLEVGRVARGLMLDPRLHALLRALLGEEPVAVQSMFYFKPPGARGQGFHQDNFYLKVRPGTCVAAWIALDEADEENGGMVVVPGTADMQIVCPQRADERTFFTTEHIPTPAGMREESIRLRAGDVLFFNGALVHGSYPNRSKDRFRRALIFHYVGIGTKRLTNWCRDPITFDGRPIAIEEAPPGGPCGTPRVPIGVRARNIVKRAWRGAGLLVSKQMREERARERARPRFFHPDVPHP